MSYVVRTNLRTFSSSSSDEDSSDDDDDSFFASYEHTLNTVAAG